jgi:dipeptidyl aminopeptidase/acylaminoacyl peptidase
MRTLIASLVLILTMAAAKAAIGEETLSAHDLLRFSQIKSVAPSPDGRYAAFEVSRSLSGDRRPHSIVTYSLGEWGLSDRFDLWLYDRKLHSVRKLVDGASGESGAFAPVWSPGGSRLAFISTSGNRLHVIIFDAATNTFHDPLAGTIEPYDDACPVWVNDRELLCATHPLGATDFAFGRGGPAVAATAALNAWQTFRNGGVSVSVEDPAAPRRHPGNLVLVDTSAWTSRSIALGSIADARVSADHRLVAYLQFVEEASMPVRGPLTLDLMAATAPWGRSNALYRLRVVRIDGSRVDLTAAQNHFVQYRSLHWSSAQQLAYVTLCGRGARGPSLCPAMLQFRNGQAIATVPLPDRITTGTDMAWSHDGHLAYRVAVPAELARWNIVSGEGTLIAHIRAAQLAAAPNSGFYSEFDGKLLRYRNGVLSAYGVSGGSVVGNGVSDDYNMVDPGLASRFVVIDVNDAHSRFAFVDPENGRTLFSVACNGSYKAATADGTLYCLHAENDGFESLAVNDRGTNRTLAYVNEFARGREAPSYRYFSYRSERGEALTGLAILPPRVRAGQRYPAVTLVYLALMIHRSDPVGFKLSGAEDLGISGSVLLLALHGFVVLVPSMPYNPESTLPGDPLLDLTNGVVPAVRKAASLGWVDPKRVGVLGHSFGGFSAMGLITQTHIFKAAVAASGFSDLTSEFGMFNPAARYTTNSDTSGIAGRNIGMYWSEVNQARMGGPPWSDPERYFRNSPIFHAQDVQTPLLLFDSDMDGTYFEQSEEMFTALFRQGKRVELVRYAGEGHILRSPANVTDAWGRVLKWFTLYLH